MRAGWVKTTRERLGHIKVLSLLRTKVMKVALPRSMLLKVADYLEKDAQELEESYYDYFEKRVTPRSMRLEVERVRKWTAQIRAAAEPKRFAKRSGSTSIARQSPETK